MSAARSQILGAIRNSLNRGRLDSDAEAKLRARIAAPHRNPIPARATRLDHKRQIELFAALAEEVNATISRVSSLAGIPEEVARYLVEANLPADIVMAPDPSMDAIPWQNRPLLRIRRGRASVADGVSLTPCLAAIAETGTLMLASGAGTPTTLNFLPDTHIVIVRADQVVATYEEAWDRLRLSDAPDTLPRTVNFITGPSRTADIEQRIELGAHGPRRVHIVLVEAGEATET
jgi:L-lactate dehydrogenase complex protein LldG